VITLLCPIYEIRRKVSDDEYFNDFCTQLVAQLPFAGGVITHFGLQTMQIPEAR
jgi:hypothetical protein